VPTRLLLVNTAAVGGGAERITRTLLDGLAARGVETRLAVGDERSADPRVVPLHANPHLYLRHRWYASGPHRTWQSLLRRCDRRLGLEDFRFPYTRHLLGIAGASPDVVLCRNLHGGWFDLRALVALSRRVPVIWLLADCWPFTGHCAYPLGCPRWEPGCHDCPHLDLPPALPVDGTRRNWRRKRRIYRRSRLHVASPSRWLLERARRSVLAPAIHEARVIPHGTDLATFTPGDRTAARRVLGIAEDAFVMAFVANGGVANPYKDAATLRRALLGLAPKGRPVELHVVGRSGDDERWGPVRVRHLPFEVSRGALAARYRAADVLVHPVLEEAFGNVVVEALACGTPVVASAAGGIPELFRDGEHGFLIPPADPGAFAAALTRLRERPLLARQLGKQAASHARKHFDESDMLSRYRDWVEQLARGAHG